MNNSSVARKIKGKTILITGGTGSFGSSVIEYLLNMGPKKIIIYSRDEKKQYDMRNLHESALLQFVIGDVRDSEKVERVMKGVDYVFHAAALKQVPSCEFFPMEAVRTNILGGNNVISAAIKNNVKRVVMLSTDKAVYPINAMGMTKALSEKLMTAAAKENAGGITSFCVVRYGNVLYSRGSVVPYFVELIRKNKKLRITSPHMTRFLLPLRDSVQLVMYALVEGGNGNIYVKKAPGSDIETLAKAACQIFDYPVELETIGVRAGEKIHETLISKEEYSRVRDEGEFYCIPPETQSLEYDKYFTKGRKSNKENEGYTSCNTKRLTVRQTVNLLLTLPEIQEELKQYKNGKQELAHAGTYSILD